MANLHQSTWSVVAEWSSTLDSSSGVVRMWVRIPAWPVTVLVSLSKTLRLRSTGRLSALARSNRRHSGEASKTMDYKTVFTNLCLELQQNRSWIKGLGKNPFTHSIPFSHSLTAVPFVRGHRSVFPRTPRNTSVYTRHPTFVTATSVVLTRLPA